MKKFVVASLLVVIGYTAIAQDSTVLRKPSRNQQKADERRRKAALAKQAEEGVLVFSRHTAGGFQLRTNGYGAFIEIGRSRSPRFTNLYVLEITEVKHPKEERSTGSSFLANSFIFGKVNNFYQVKLGFGQQYVFGQKGNKNGIAVLGIAQGGLSMGLMKPYYVQTRSGEDIKYESEDSLRFLTPAEINGGAGFAKGWNEVKLAPGVFAKVGLRFDFGRFNESIHALEIGMSVDYYTQKVRQMVYNEPRQLFFQGHLAYIFGRRK